MGYNDIASRWHDVSSIAVLVLILSSDIPTDVVLAHPLLKQASRASTVLVVYQSVW